MRNWMSMAMLAALAFGCAKKDQAQAPPVQPMQFEGPHSLYGSPATGDAALVNHEFLGQTAVQWAEKLSDSSRATREEAYKALGQLDQEGFSFLLQGMKSRSSETRLAALQAAYKPVLVKNKEATLPLVQHMLRDEDPQVRLNAALRMSWFEADARTALSSLQYLAATDSNPEIRDAAKLSMIVINYHVTGRKPSHGSMHP